MTKESSTCMIFYSYVSSFPRDMAWSSSRQHFTGSRAAMLETTVEPLSEEINIPSLNQQRFFSKTYVYWCHYALHYNHSKTDLKTTRDADFLHWACCSGTKTTTENYVTYDRFIGGLSNDPKSFFSAMHTLDTCSDQTHRKETGSLSFLQLTHDLRQDLTRKSKDFMQWSVVQSKTRKGILKS